MLVLSRRLAETLRIGDDIEITVIGVSGNQVRLGIVAPREVTVDREEVYQRKKAGAPKPATHDDDQMQKPVVTRVNRTEVRNRLFGRGHEAPQ